MLSLIVNIVFLLLALVLVVDTFYPLGLTWRSGRVGPIRFIWLVFELLALAVIYWLIQILFLGVPMPPLK